MCETEWESSERATNSFLQVTLGKGTRGGQEPLMYKQPQQGQDAETVVARKGARGTRRWEREGG